MSIALPAELARFVDCQIASGHYASRSEVVRAALRAWAEWDAWVAGTDGPSAAGGPSAADGPHAAGGPDAAGGQDAARGPKATTGTGEEGLPLPLLEHREELLKIAAEEGVSDVRVLSTRPPTAAVEAGARLECVEMLGMLARDRTLQDLARASVRMGRVLECVVLLSPESLLSPRLDGGRGLRKARPL